MRMQSPASSGLLPATYSRRRRKPNKSLVDGSSNVVDNVDVDDGSGTPRRSLSGGKSLHLYLASNGAHEHELPDDMENDENDKRRSNGRNDAYDYEELDKPLNLSDFAINDRCYQRYLQEGKRGTYTGIRNKKAALGSSGKGLTDSATWAKLCAGWSFMGMLFLAFVAIVTETQPLFIKGLPTTSARGDDGTYRFRVETSNALKAAAAYFLTMVLSLIYLQAMDMNLELSPALGRLCHLRRLFVSTYLAYRRRHYADIPDGDSAFGVTSGLILPMHQDDHDKYHNNRRRRKRLARRKHGGDSGGGAVEGVIGRIKSWGIGGGSASKGRKKDK